ncbi:AraC family transcriptional regulator [Bifidobacterium avesanii]|uniref:Helix-turn-helix domain-containing protein n=1 Tax=Bifidobacterium avesanii TaxID=1798157 RepID=A0A7K3TH42_9BIFI|nr:AraC family transcriptional regulator [Bifidobacterium avesanii]KAB8292812.1 AraC family transcriptional regulator [Bifidobacterium avesanii]NEG78418.1 helix-turn-helix domain-containing protein [Bifidobacterium avesanii]
MTAERTIDQSSPKSSNPLTIFSDLSETPHYNLPGLPMYARRDSMHRYGFRMACHWHRDLEFIHVLNGHPRVFVNGALIPLHAGEGIFINSRRMHYLICDDGDDAGFVSAVIDASLLGAMYAPLAAAMLKRMDDTAPDYVVLDSTRERDRTLLFGIDELERLLSRCESQQETGDALTVLPAVAQSAHLCFLTLERINEGTITAEPKTVDQRTSEYPTPSSAHAAANDPGPEFRSFLLMMAFIRANASQKITLDDIARAGIVGRRVCCELFRTYAGQTPIDYLTDYRLGKARELLSEGTMSIKEISQVCGFSSPAYFSYVFRQHMDTTPRQWRDREMTN